MKIVPSADIGELGPSEGVAVSYNWKLYYSALSLLLWIVLIFAIVLVKENHDHRALLIILPLLVVNLLWFGFVELLNVSSSVRLYYDPIVASYSVGIAMLWLLAHKIVNLKRFVTFILALALMTIVGLIGAISYRGFEFSLLNFYMITMLCFFPLITLVAFVLASRRCRKRYNGSRFALSLAFWMMFISIAGLLVLYSILFFRFRMQLHGMIFAYLYMALIGGSAYGLFIFWANLPFLILGLNNSFFRERFYSCLHIRPMPTITVQAEPDGLYKQNSAQEISQENNSS